MIGIIYIFIEPKTSYFTDKQEILDDTHWWQTLDRNKTRWKEKSESCDNGLEASTAAHDIRPPLVFKRQKRSLTNGFNDDQDVPRDDDTEVSFDRF